MIEIKQLKGLQSYEETLLRMENAVIDIIQGKLNEQIWFLEHQSVFTAGSSTPKNFNQKK